MKPNTTALERAFELANSGSYHSIGDIKRKLAAEGYHPQVVTGNVLLKQLRAIILDTTHP